MSLTDQITYSVPDHISEDHKRNVLFSHRGYIASHSSTVEFIVDSNLSYKFKYNLYHYLSASNVDSSLHWIVMVINGFNNPCEFTPKTRTLLIPDISLISDILALID